MPVTDTDETSTSRRARRLPAVGEFLSVEALGGLILASAVVAALVWANAAPDSYTSFWSYQVSLGGGSASVTESLAHWVTDGLMTIFFFVAGLEIKRELVVGELRNRRTAALPVFAAIGGMVVPAVLYLAVTMGDPGSRGWGIPMATDIAFAVAVVALLSNRVPRALKLFLLTLAIVDDIGAIVVIALFYSRGVSLGWLLAGALGIVGIVALRRFGAVSPVAYVLPGLALWLCFLESGVHATIAGVVLGLLTPAGLVRGRPVIEQLEHLLHPWSSLVVVPLFALASAGVILDVDALRSASGSAATWGVILGLVLGKPLGIFLASALAVRLRVAHLPDGLRFTHVLGAGMVAGIGFTVSLFVADLSFAGTTLSDAKIGILVASLSSAVLGVAYLVASCRQARSVPPGVPTLDPVAAR
jgi:Na+:H+ antiporter, NhaA family